MITFLKYSILWSIIIVNRWHLSINFYRYVSDGNAMCR